MLVYSYSHPFLDHHVVERYSFVKNKCGNLHVIRDTNILAVIRISLMARAELVPEVTEEDYDQQQV